MAPGAAALILFRIRFGSAVSFPVAFPAFTTGLAAWLAVLEGLSLVTRPAHPTPPGADAGVWEPHGLCARGL